MKEMNNKLLIQRQKNKDHATITKVAAEYFRASNSPKPSNGSPASDTVKTKTVSNGNKALTNDSSSSPLSVDSDNSIIVPNSSDVNCSSGSACNDDVNVTSKDESNTEVTQSSQQTVSILNAFKYSFNTVAINFFFFFSGSSKEEIKIRRIFKS